MTGRPDGSLINHGTESSPGGDLVSITFFSYMSQGSLPLFGLPLHSHGKYIKCHIRVAYHGRDMFPALTKSWKAHFERSCLHVFQNGQLPDGYLNKSR